MVHTYYLGILALWNGLPGAGKLPRQAYSTQLAVLTKVQFSLHVHSLAARTGARQLSTIHPFNQLCMLLAMIDLQVT